MGKIILVLLGFVFFLTFVSSLGVNIPAPSPNYTSIVGNLTSNLSQYAEIWITSEGDMDDVSDINAGDITDDGTYWKSDGTSTATGNWNLGNKNVTTTGQFNATKVRTDGIGGKTSTGTLNLYPNNSLYGLSVQIAGGGRTVLDSLLTTEIAFGDDIVSYTDNQKDLGTSTYRWNDLNLGGNIKMNGTITNKMKSTDTQGLIIDTGGTITSKGIIEVSGVLRPNVNSYAMDFGPSLNVTGGTQGYSSIYSHPGVGAITGGNIPVVSFKSELDTPPGGGVNPVTGFQSIGNTFSNSGDFKHFEAKQPISGGSVVLNAGTYNLYGAYLEGGYLSTATNTLNQYGIYLKDWNKLLNYGGTHTTNFYDMWTTNGADWVFDSDNQKLILGAGQDAWMEWDGTNFNFNQTGTGTWTFYNSSGLGTIRYGSALTSTTINNDSNVLETFNLGNDLYNLDGTIKHSAFGECFSLVNDTDFSRPEIEYYEVEICEIPKENRCENVTTCDFVLVGDYYQQQCNTETVCEERYQQDCEESFNYKEVYEEDIFVGYEKISYQQCSDKLPECHNETFERTIYPHKKETEVVDLTCEDAKQRQAMALLNRNVNLYEGLTDFDTGIIAEEIFTQSKTIEDGVDYVEKIKDGNKLKNKRTHYAYNPNILESGLEGLNMEERIVVLEGALNKVLTETCEKQPNQWSWCGEK